MQTSSALNQLFQKKSSVSKYSDEPSESTPPTDCDDRSHDSSLSSMDTYDDGVEVRVIPQKMDSDDELDKVEKLRLAADPQSFYLGRLDRGEGEVPCAVEYDTDQEDSSIDSNSVQESCHTPSHTVDKKKNPSKLRSSNGKDNHDNCHFDNSIDTVSSEEYSDQEDKYNVRRPNVKRLVMMDQLLKLNLSDLITHHFFFSLLDEEEALRENQVSLDETESSNCYICTVTDGSLGALLNELVESEALGSSGSNEDPDKYRSLEKGNRVSFNEELVTEVNEFQRCKKEDKRNLFYSARDMQMFRIEYIMELQAAQRERQKKLEFKRSSTFGTMKIMIMQILECQSLSNLCCNNRKASI